MAVSVAQVQQWVEAWAADVDPEVELQQPHDNPRKRGDVIPVRPGRHGYRMTVGFPESSFPGSPLPEETCRTLMQVIRLLRCMETRDLHRPGAGGPI
jgi:hypothetical protein